MNKGIKVHLLVIDPQVDFMDSPGSALPVTGANEDMSRLSAMINRIGGKLEDVHVTLDSHRVIDVAHPGMWENQAGKQPAPFTIISADDIKNEIWLPRNHNARPASLGGKTLGAYMLGYARALEQGGKYPLMIWPEHCLIGTPGHNVQRELAATLQKWERDNFATVNYVTKGTSPFTEHYGGLQAEVPLANDPSTGLNSTLLNVLAQADIVVVAGEALSHCVKETVTQIADNIGEKQIEKFYILTDCTSPVPQPPGGPDFPAIAKDFLMKMKGRGMKLTTSVDFLT